ncbi:hypothetical protein O0L34_g2748 [Tuta absoluta]|nr:hypothetical protein O0L34_g2748 [Tuta absoluta]
MPIKFLYARQIFDSMGVPTVEVDMVTELGLFRVGVPNTDVSKKERRGNVEAHQLRDGVPDEYHGMGVTMAVKNINTIISPELIKMNLEVTMEIDQFMCAMDGTENKSRLGSNAIMAVSMVVAKAGAAKKGLPLYRYISDLAGVISLVMPVPHFVILNGGILATNDLPMQEYSIMPTAATSFSEAMRVGTEIYTYVKNIIRNKYGVTATYPCDNGSNFQSHSLSWSRRGERPPGSTLHAKIWVPEDPRIFTSTNNVIEKDEHR